MSLPLMMALRQLGARRALQESLNDELESRVSAPIFLVMRRMRAPLITLIVLFGISVVGLSLVPGIDGDGNPTRMSLFDSFYVISYTATTIGFGEIPWPFTAAQRLWVTVSIYLSVVGWAYAIGSLLTLVQDRSFRKALAMRRFTRKVARLREPFVLLAGYGQAGRLLVQSFDALGQRVVVLDRSDERIEMLDLESLHADVPGLASDAANPRLLHLAGLGMPNCEGVLALTDDDETNLSIAMTVAMLRPDVPVIARTVSVTIADRMHAFGTPAVVNPFDRFGDHLRMALRAPATYQLLTWLEAGPGAELPPRGILPPDGRWVICGFGRFGRELTRDLRDTGLEVVVIEATAAAAAGEPGVIAGDGSELRVLAEAGLDSAVGVVAGTDNDTTNLSVLANARKLNPDLFLAARQNHRSNTALFRAMQVDALLVPTEVVAHEVYAQVSTPLLWRFLQDMPAEGDAWAAALVDRLRGCCGENLPALWNAELNPEQAPALLGPLRDGGVRIDDLLRSPEDRERRLLIVPLLLRRGTDIFLCPDDDFVLAVGDEMLFAGAGYERRELEFTMVVESTAQYVLFDRYLPSSLVWRKLSRRVTHPGRASHPGRADRASHPGRASRTLSRDPHPNSGPNKGADPEK